PVLLLPPPARCRARCRLGRSFAGRHVPSLAVLPAPPVVDEAARAGGTRDPGVPAIRLEQPSRRGARDAGTPPWSHGRHVLFPVAARDGDEPRPVRRTG